MQETGDQSRETPRSSKKSQGESGWYPLHDEDASPNASELITASLHEPMTVKLPDMLKPIIHGEETIRSTHEVIRGDWRERVSKDWQQVPGDPSQCINGEESVLLGYMGINNHVSCRRRESEWSIVAEKRGNSCGAKGLYVSHVSKKRARTA